MTRNELGWVPSSPPVPSPQAPSLMPLPRSDHAHPAEHPSFQSLTYDRSTETFGLTGHELLDAERPPRPRRVGRLRLIRVNLPRPGFVAFARSHQVRSRERERESVWRWVGSVPGLRAGGGCELGQVSGEIRPGRPRVRSSSRAGSAKALGSLSPGVRRQIAQRQTR